MIKFDTKKQKIQPKPQHQPQHQHQHQPQHQHQNQPPVTYNNFQQNNAKFAKPSKPGMH